MRRIVTLAGRLKSFELVAVAMAVAADVDITGRHVQRLTQEVGADLARQRDDQAACYRRRQHMNVSFFVDMLPPTLHRLADLVAELLMGLFAVFMVIWGEKLVEATWNNSIPDFPALSVGVTYLPIPLGGAALLAFVIERLIAPPLAAAPAHAHPASH